MSQIEGISVETLMLANKYTDEHGGGGGGATDAGSVSYDETKTYKEGTVGAELTAQSRQLSDLEDTVSTTQIINTASGEIASFDDGADGQPIRKLVANIEPVQDLHGYENPWPAGGGVNKLPPPVDGTYGANGVTAVVNGGVITISGTTTSSGNAAIIPLSEEFTVPDGSFLHLLNSAANSGLSISFEQASNPGIGTGISPNHANRIYEIPSDSYGRKWDRIRIYAGNNITVSGTISPMVCIDNTVRSYSPYSNICPISGWTGAEIEHRGKNLLPSTYSVYDTTMSLAYGFISAIMPENVDAIMSFTDKDNSVDIRGIYFGFIYNYHGGSPETFKWCINNGNVYADLSNKSSSGSGTVGTLCEGIIIYPKTEEAFNKIFSRYNVQVELGSTATAYEPYTGDQISVNWEDEAGTVYGGYFTLNNDNSVDLTALDELITLDGISNKLVGKSEDTTHGAALYFANIGERTRFRDISGPFSNMLQFSLNSYTNMTLYSFPGSSGASTTCHIILPSGTTVEEGNAWLQSMVTAGTPVQVRRKLVTPQNWHFDNIGQLQTFLGTNNVWSSTGDTEVTYPADTKLYIDNKITQAIAAALNA